MNREELIAKWRTPKSVIDSSKIERIREWTDGERWGVWCKCPCGGEDHYGHIPMILEGFSRHEADILTCYFTDKQWIIRRAPVAYQIWKEEMAFIDLLNKAQKVVAKVVAKRGVSEDTVRYLHETHGVPREVSEELLYHPIG